MSTVFGKIIRGELPCKKEFESETVLAFHDIAPQAPIHILIVPKKEIPDLQSVTPSDYFLIGEMIHAAQQIAKKLGVENSYRLVTNIGSKAGQAVFHLHFHFLAGRELSHKLG